MQLSQIMRIGKEIRLTFNGFQGESESAFILILITHL